MHVMSLRQFSVFYHGDRSGEVRIQNHMTGESMEVDSDVLLQFAAETVREERIRKLERGEPAAMLELPSRHPAFYNRRDCVPSKRDNHVFWCVAGTPLGPMCDAPRDSWHFWDEAGQYGGGPYDSESEAMAALARYVAALQEEGRPVAAVASPVQPPAPAAIDIASLPLVRLLMAACGLTIADFSVQASDLFVIAHPGVREWLKANYRWADSVTEFTSPRDSNWKGAGRTCLDIPCEALWQSQRNLANAAAPVETVKGETPCGDSTP